MSNLLDKFSSSQRMAQFHQQVINMINLPVSHAQVEMGEIMYKMNTIDRESYVNLISFHINEARSKNNYQAASKLSQLASIAEEIRQSYR